MIRVLELWDKLSDIPIDDNDLISVQFEEFPIGTPRLEIWEWLEEELDVKIRQLLFQQRGGTFGSLWVGDRFTYLGIEMEKIFCEANYGMIHNARHIESGETSWLPACLVIDYIAS